METRPYLMLCTRVDIKFVLKPLSRKVEEKFSKILTLEGIFNAMTSLAKEIEVDKINENISN